MKKLCCLCFLFVILSCVTPKDLSLSNKQTALVKEANALLGSPYKYGGNNPSGFDCSGFTSYVYSKALNIKLNRSSNDQSRMGKKVKISDLEPGDLIFFKLNPDSKINHVSLVSANKGDQLIVIHSTTSRGVIKQDVMASQYWKSRMVFAKRII